MATAATWGCEETKLDLAVNGGREMLELGL